MKINSYILSNKTRNDMVDAIGRSIKDDIEYGFRLCIKDNIINHGNLCKGKECSIESSKFECKDNEKNVGKNVGIFHTHKNLLDPSVRDLSVGYLDGMNCIGSIDGIRCFKRKREDLDALEYSEIRLVEDKEKFIKIVRDKWLASKINNYEYIREVKKYKKEIDRLINSYFKIIDIMK